MSGPKVVRVISREEKLERINQQQDLMQRALGNLKKFALSHALFDVKLSKELNERELRYTALNERDYSRVEEFATQEIAFLNEYQQRLTNQLIEQQQRLKQRVQRLVFASSRLKKVYQQREQSIPDIFNEIEVTSLDNNVEKLASYEQQLQRAYQILATPAKGKKLSAEQHALQARLQTGQAISNYNQWLAEQIPSRSKQQARLDYLISHLQLLETSSPQQEAFIERAQTLEKHSKKSSLSLKIDSLILDVSEFIKQQQDQQELLDNLQAVLNTLLRLVPDSNTEMMAIIKAALINPTQPQRILRTLLEQAEDYVLIQQRHYIAESRRQAVLGGLHELGYSINEDMSTAWVEDGRLIVKKSPNNNYGVELSSPNDVQRIQARIAVNKQAPDNVVKDKQAEEIWCDDFSQLREQLAQEDNDIVIDKALEAGSRRVKKIETKDWIKESERQVRYGNDRGLLEQQLKGK